MYVGAVLFDLSKAFDCLPHNLLICKLKAYGFSINACKLMASYLSHRKQRVKLGEHRSSWQYLSKGVPQGSIIGPILFNAFIHDLFYLMKYCLMFNYADDDTLLYAHTDLHVLKSRLAADAETAFLLLSGATTVRRLPTTIGSCWITEARGSEQGAHFC